MLVQTALRQPRAQAAVVDRRHLRQAARGTGVIVGAEITGVHRAVNVDRDVRNGAADRRALRVPHAATAAQQSLTGASWGWVEQ